jgi:inner membrane transporter RhtA
MMSALAGPRRLAEKIPVALWLVTAICSATLASSLSVTVIHQIGSPATTALRLLWAALFFLTVARPKVWRMERHQLLGALALGIITAGMSFFFFAAAGRIPLGMTVAIEFLGPLAVALAGSRRLRDLLWVVLAAGGVWLLTSQDHASADTIGIALAGASAVCWGGYILMTRRVGKVLPGLQGLALSMAVAAMIGLPIGIAPHWQALSIGTILFMLLISLLAPILTFSLEMASLRRMEPRHFGILMSLEPVMAAVMGFLVLGQRLSAAQLAGMACVTLASIGTVAGRAKEAPPIAEGET